MSTELVTTDANTSTNQAIMLDFDTNTIAGQKRVFNALNAAQSLSTAGIDTLAIDGMIIRPSQRVDQVTGEYVECDSVTFLSGDTSYFSTSAGIVSSARNLMAALGGAFPEGETITLEFRSQPLAGGRTLKYFVWA